MKPSHINIKNISNSYRTALEDDEEDLSLRPVLTLTTQDTTFSRLSIPGPTPNSASAHDLKSDQPAISQPSASKSQASTGDLQEAPMQRLAPKGPKDTFWKISWQEPTFICAMLIMGLGLSLAHHLYYLTLSGTMTGDTAKQAWPLRFGTAFAFLICSTFQATTAAASGQYIWTVVRKRSLKISSLDKLYSMTSNPQSIFSRELFKTARITILLGVIFWCVGLVGIALPATLSIIPRNITVSAPILTLDFSKRSWTANVDPEGWHSDVITQIIATQAASSFDIVRIPPLVKSLDWSYDYSFYGPTMNCSTPSYKEGLGFDQVSALLAASDGTTTDILYSSWSPLLPLDTPNYWNPGWEEIIFSESIEADILQLMIQTSTSRIVCNPVNASFDVTIASVNGSQQVTQHQIQVSAEQNIRILNGAYLAPFFALAALLIGNITVSTANISTYRGNQDISSASTSMVSTSLNACDDIQNSPFRDWFSDSEFQPGVCRNRTLTQAIEDLANNITLIYLSSSDLSNHNTIFRNITTSNTISIYQYHPLYLFLSYGIGFFFASVAAIIGIYAMIDNGVSHSAAFSTIIATTRNPDLDSLTRGASLGAEPLPKDIKKVKLRFGPLLRTHKVEEIGEKQGKESEEAQHIAFGFEKTVGTLRKGASYV